MLQKDLKKLHLSDNEARTYLALLELGEAPMHTIVKKCGLNRSTTYLAVEALKRRGLVSAMIGGKRRHYVAEDPRTLNKILAEEEEALQKMLPQLMSLANNIASKPTIRFYEGAEGIKSVYRDTLEYHGQEILMWGSLKAMECFDNEFLTNYYLVERLERKIWMRAIGPRTPVVEDIKSRDKTELRQTRLINSPEKFPFDVEINLYGSKFIGIMSFTESFGMIIESRAIYTTIKSFFELQWIALADGDNYLKS